jgi:hypothetical protein
MKIITLAALAFGGAAWTTSPTALAAEPTHTGGSISGLAGFGTNADGFNFGVRGGYTLQNHWYLGGTIIGNTGLGNTQLAGWGLGFTLGAEAGYEIAAGPVVIRPYGGLGFTSQSYSGYAGTGTYNATLCAEGQYQYCSGGVAANPTYNPTLCAEGVAQSCNPGLNAGLAGASATTTSVAFWVGTTVLYDFAGGPWFLCGDVRVGDAPSLVYEQLIFAVMAGGGYEF